MKAADKKLIELEEKIVKGFQALSDGLDRKHEQEEEVRVVKQPKPYFDWIWMK